MQTLTFELDEAFGWEIAGRPLARMHGKVKYSERVQFIGMLFFRTRVLLYMGPRPSEEGRPVYKSFSMSSFRDFKLGSFVII